ncbi:hypothetical protein ACN2MM_06280 [Alkalilimnicola ehrlichii MLHE-1]|uniref:Uncharacterized protein n=1 Tax=Alkalilimnicola ehrlichii (strain ATCC BAA-1101 / DSM 17681 / MLHE-1) TaxID=187272 RepID=Q0A9L0_ALKEH|nr:hypothetical protein [Alkalilimnicola ehrlichii]ABI56477.1 hypothetical protein Mlg_1126 [Alkalilimnicola ehrlichii MLHE-1]
MPNNQNPEQRARDRIDEQLRASGWTVQSLAALNPQATRGVAVREYPTDGQVPIGTIQRLYFTLTGEPLP